MVVKKEDGTPSSSTTASRSATPRVGSTPRSTSSAAKAAKSKTTSSKGVKKTKGTGRTKVTRHVDQRVQARNSALNAFGGVKVDVFVRVRPKIPDIEGSQKVCVSVDHENGTLEALDQQGHPTKYTYDKVYGPESSQTDVYDDCVSPIVEQVSSGLSCCIFAYGQTGAGKTFTMRGDLSKDEAQYGIIQRALIHLMKRLHEHEYTEIKVSCSFLEIYNEELEDLFAENKLSSKKHPTTKSSASSGLVLVDDDARGCICKGLREIDVESVDQVMDLLHKGEKRARYSETKMNKLSNRAHRIFTLLVQFKRYDKPVNATLTFVDLAGSEDISKSGATGLTAREASHINRSLLTLGRVINALASNDRHIPYRDSKLTRLLSEALGGVCKTSFIACVSPCDGSYTESNNTLRYAERAMEALNISQFPRWKQDEIMIDGLTRRVQQLVDELESVNKIHKEEMHIMKSERDRFEQECLQHLRNLNRAKRKIQRLLERKTELKSGVSLLTSQKHRLLSEKTSLQDELLETRAVRDGLFSDRDTLNMVMAQVREMRNTLLEAHTTTEGLLHTDANKLKSVIEGAIVDIDDLHTEVTRKKALSVHNEKAADDYRSRLSAHVRNLIQETEQFKNAQNDHQAVMNGMVVEMRGTQQKETAALTTDIVNINSAIEATFTALIQAASDHEKSRKTRINQAKENADKTHTAMKEMLEAANTALASKVNGLLGHGAALDEVMKAWSDKVQTHFSEAQTTVSAFAGETTKSLKQFEAQMVAATNSQIAHLDAHQKALESHLKEETALLQVRSDEIISEMTSYITRVVREHTEQTRVRTVAAMSGFKDAAASLEHETKEYVAQEKAQLADIRNSIAAHDEDIEKKIGAYKAASTQAHANATGRLEEIKDSANEISAESTLFTTKATASSAGVLEDLLQELTVEEKVETQRKAAVDRVCQKGIRDMALEKDKLKNKLTTSLDAYVTASTALGGEMQTRTANMRDHCDTAEELLFDTEADGVHYVMQEIKRDIQDPPARKGYVYPTEYAKTPQYGEILSATAENWAREDRINTGKANAGKGVDFVGEKGKDDHSGLLTSTVEAPLQAVDQNRLDRAAYESDMDEYSDPEGFVDPIDRSDDEDASGDDDDDEYGKNEERVDGEAEN